MQLLICNFRTINILSVSFQRFSFQGFLTCHTFLVFGDIFLIMNHRVFKETQRWELRAKKLEAYLIVVCMKELELTYRLDWGIFFVSSKFLFMKLTKLRLAQQINSCECSLKCTFLRCCQEEIASSILVCLSYILLHLCSSAG